MPSRWTHKFKIKPDCWVFVPNAETYELGHEIKEAVNAVWRPPPYYAHLQKGGHIAALNSHLQSKHFIRADIRQFFNHINRNRITRNLKNLFQSYSQAREVANHSTVRNPAFSSGEYILPYGFVQSPIIASLCLYKSALGKYLHSLKKSGFLVTVYMDDILISTDQSAEILKQILANIHDKAAKSGFPLSTQKTSSLPDIQTVAFHIQIGPGISSIVPARLAKFALQIQQSTNPHQIGAILRYVKQVNQDQFEELFNLLAETGS